MRRADALVIVTIDTLGGATMGEIQTETKLDYQVTRESVAHLRMSESVYYGSVERRRTAAQTSTLRGWHLTEEGQARVAKAHKRVNRWRRFRR